MGIILVLFALVAGVIGFLNLSQATMGIGILAIGCLFGILARIAQADMHHKDLVDRLGSLDNKPRPPEPNSSPISNRPANWSEPDR